ncbi:MAG: 3-hydroxy-2-methylbutyryl-CoA dehydrogenase [Candidatus Entotheonella factor]|uniref:3-hydroxy-2-methylbutyryl-CoA dehydrogenase n=1 Tax=Entotheonella factor TaxID=1429438 RepID=W4LEN1_ENTF1|nr:MAG: 3-hydroxy-2-methylbutyryl-CoA dehydrogenase [Candidatus Entotheonella factor]
MQIEGEVAVITGGASGLGGASARLLYDSGAKVVILDVNAEAGQALAAELGDSALYIHTDVTSPESSEAAIVQARETFGSVDIAINCAGIGTPGRVLSRSGPLALDTFSRVIQINLIGTFNIIRLAAAQMQDNAPNADGERGVIINTASIAAFDGQIGQPAYSASKAGVVGMTLPIARELASFGIRIMTIAPGIFDTPMLAGLPDPARQSLAASVPFPQRLGLPEEYASMAKYIIESPMLNGETIRLDGALRMAPR